MDCGPGFLPCDQNRANADSCNLVTAFPAVSELWVRYWQYVENWGTNPLVNENKVIYFHTNGVGYPNVVTMNYNQHGTGLNPGQSWQNTRDCGSPTVPFPAGAYHADCNEPWNAEPNLGISLAVQNEWQCFEHHMLLNTVTGGVPDRNAVIESFVNGTRVMAGTNLALQPWAPGGGGLVTFGYDFNFYRQGALAGSVMYFDDVAAGTERIGCGGTLQPPSVQILSPTSNTTYITRTTPL